MKVSELLDEQGTVLRNTDPAHVWICELLLQELWHVVVSRRARAAPGACCPF